MRRLLLLVLALASTVAPVVSADRPNFLWIIAEDLSPFLGCYGHQDARTPHLDALAARSHTFLRAYATAPVCSPSRSGLASGVYPTSLGSQHMFSDIRLPDSADPVMRLLKQHGYWTALRGKTCFNFDDAGLFDYWKTDTAPWRQCPEGRPFFAYMNLGQTHEGPGNSSQAAAEPLSRLPEGAKHNPGTVDLPPFYPDTPEMRRIWARYLDLLSVWDRDVHEVLEGLAADGHADDTIVFVLSDHGMGLPRFKRWLHLTGLHVPLIVHVPEKFRHLVGDAAPGTAHDRLVSLLDLPATTLEMAGLDVPDYYHGHSLFDSPERSHVFGARDRLDDLRDLSRSVFDGRYLYIRHYQPHLVPMRPGVIMSGHKKESIRELARLHRAGADTPESAEMWRPRPFEELYDLQEDPWETDNRAADPQLAEVKAVLADRLREWILETRDSGFASEPEMLRRSQQQGIPPYTWLQDPAAYPLAAVLDAADAASRPDGPTLEASDEPILTWWALQQRIIRSDFSPAAIDFFAAQLESESPAVRLAAAEGLAKAGLPEPTLPVFREALASPEPWVPMHAARILAVSLDNVRPLEKEIRATLEAIQQGPAGPSCRQWSVSTVQALDWALIKCGLEKFESIGRH